MLGNINLKALRPDNLKKQAQKTLRPIIVKKTKQGGSCCGK